ncbi:MAG: exodeoxyribonuclease V subunit gamma [Myxococcota bacterium]
MELTRSNRTEALADALADAVRDAPLGPFERETIVVQSRGMERWLTLALAKRLGVWSNPSFPFPRAVVESVLHRLDEGASERSRAYEPQALKWTLASLLNEDPPSALDVYLTGENRADRTLRLAGSLASVFDRYVVTRPEMLEAWVGGHGDHWQAALWRRLVETLGPYDLSSRIARALPALDSGRGTEALGSSRLHLFSLETLPRPFLRFFGALSRHIPTHLYLLAPTSEYVSDVDDKGQLSLDIERGVDGHPLITSLGALARDFQELLLDDGAYIEREHDRFVSPGRNTLLRHIQSDVLEFRAPPEPNARVVLNEDDPSIAVHACTSPMREVMVLHDAIREALEAEPTLRPEDVVVMTPDLDAYAPAFRAVFGESQTHPIPFEVHDRRAREDAPFYDDFLAVLEVLESRFSVLDVVRLMDTQSWRPEFRFSPDERARLTELLEASGIRWGIDGAHRQRLGFPAEDLHTWRAGLARLFLGFATAPGQAEVFASTLPRGNLDLSDAELLARLSRLCHVLFDFHERVANRAPVRTWAEGLARLSGTLFAEEDDTSGAVRTLRTTLESLGHSSDTHGFGTPVTLAAVRREVAAAVVQNTPAAGFLRRGVTLSELVPLRSIPFRMICLLGMREDAFPRADDRPSFDLTRSSRSVGDRDKRRDDRHSFLQTSLCARDRLVITYSAPASSTRIDPTPAPPVSELLETIARYTQQSSEDTGLSIVDHPLHAFDAAYFDGSCLLGSFSERYRGVAEALQGPRSTNVRAALEAEPREPKLRIPVAELAQWIWHPTREFIQRQLRTRFDDSALYEPAGALTELGKLERFRVGNEALERGLRGEALAAFLEASPEFPDGSPGDARRESLARELSVLVHAADGALESTTAVPLVVTVGDFTIEGRIDGMAGEVRTKIRFNRAETKTELSTWLEHLLMQAASEQNPKTTVLHLRGSEVEADRVRFEPVADPKAVLRSLLTLYVESRSRPAALLNRPSWRFASMVVDGRGEGALEEAIKLQQNELRWDRYARFAWGKEGPFVDRRWADEFCETTLEVYRPLMSHRSVE